MTSSMSTGVSGNETTCKTPKRHAFRQGVSTPACLCRTTRVLVVRRVLKRLGLARRGLPLACQRRRHLGPSSRRKGVGGRAGNKARYSERPVRCCCPSVETRRKPGAGYFSARPGRTTPLGGRDIGYGAL